MLYFSVNYTLKLIEKIIMKISHGFLDSKIVTHVVLEIRKLKLKYLHIFKILFMSFVEETLIYCKENTSDGFVKLASEIN